MLGSGNNATSISMMMGDIWSTGAFSFESPLKDLLDTGNYTLEQLLAEDELLQELRGLHPVLLDFFSNPHVVADLVRHAVVAAEEDDDEPTSSSQPEQAGADPNAAVASPAAPLSGRKNAKTLATAGTFALSDPEFRSVRLPYMACEVICCELSCVIDTIVDGTLEGQEGDGSPPTAPERVGEGATDDVSTPSSPPRHQHQILDSDPDSVEVVGEHRLGISSPPPPTGEGAVTPSASAGPPKQQKRILDLLFSIVLQNEVLDDYRAGYFEKILRVLFRRRSDDMVQYVNDRADTLLPALLRHLYSHSILQVVQRLLLPHRPVPKKTLPTSDPNLDPDKTRIGSIDSDIPVGLVEGIDDDDENANNNTSINIIAGEEDEGGANIIDDPHAGEIKSDWSRRPEALGMLLDMLLLGRDDNEQGGDIDDNEDDVQRQRRLDMSLNAAEVLITMIQNSLMSSTVMLTLTSSHILERIIVAASTLPSSTSAFSPHESTTTAAMSVLESLILQLGGYGAIGTMSMLEDVMMESAELLQQAQQAQLDSYADLYPPTSPRHAGSSQDEPNHPSSTTASSASNSLSPDLVRIADLTSLLEHLPLLLDNLSALLRHPDCESWKSCTQFSKDVPVQQLGSARLRIVRVIESLVLLGDPEVDARLVQSDCLEICLNLFWDFQWCSMLHQSVANLLVHVLEGQNMRVEMQEYFLIRCNLLVRLMDSFVDPATASTAVAGTAPPVRDRLSISEDDVDAAIEKQQEADAELGAAGGSSTASEADNASAIVMVPPPQSFRYGYMGHVIIICQALVHACKDGDENATAAGDAGGEASTAASSSVQQHSQPRQMDSGDGADQLPGATALGHMIASGVTKKQQLEVFSRSGGDESTAVSKEPLYLAEMVACHPLSHKWKEFVATTLTTETTIQSTPLGGFDAAAMMEGMQMHRPGLADDGDDMGLEPPSRMGDVLDMDDNDLEIAATMMAGLAVSARGHALDDDDDEASGDSNRSYNSGETNKSGGGYVFDDPLGRLNGGLGIELGKLTKYNPDTDDPDAVLKDANVENGDDGDEDDNGSTGSPNSYHSSDDEQERRESEKDVPVLDLFAGNFDFGSSQEPTGSDDAAGQDWSDFANFDDAFATVGAQPAMNPTESALAGSSPPVGDTLEAVTVGGDAQLGDSSSQHSSSDLDDLFGPGDHASLLALDEVKPDTTGVSSPSAVAPEVSVVVQSDEPSPSPMEQDPAQDDVEILAAPSDELKADLSEQGAPATMFVEQGSEGT